MKIRYVTLLAAIAGLMAACGNDRKVEPGPSPVSYTHLKRI